MTPPPPCGCTVKYEGQDHWQRPIENGIAYCPLHANASRLRDALAFEHMRKFEKISRDTWKEHKKMECDTCDLLTSCREKGS